jgi:molybdate/tungstate transport system substrate-binding protein
MTRPARLLASLALLPALACTPRGEKSADSGRGSSSSAGPLVVYNAGSLARPIRAALDSFARTAGVEVEQESAGSLETARKLTELGHVPDLIALADAEVFPQLLVPSQTTWYAAFARNRMVIAYTPRSRFASEITADSWWRVLQRPGVEVGRADPNLDPNGYRTLLTLQLAERYYAQPGLAATLLKAAGERNVRPKEADLVALLQAGELDYIWSYESIAEAAGLRYVTLPHQVDLGTPGDSLYYASAVVRVRGRTPSDTIEFRGQPIVYAFSVPRAAPHPELAARFAAFLLSAQGKTALRAARLDALEQPVVFGQGAPPGVTARSEVSAAVGAPAAATSADSARAGVR